MASKPIVILGFPRSGTTLLRRMLDAHPNIACPGETFLLRSAARFLRGEAIAGGLDYGVIGGLNALGVDRDELYTKLRDLIDFFLGRHAKKEGKERWSEKTAVNAFHIDEIEALYCGHAQFVCIVRHGLDVVASCHDLTVANERILDEFHSYVQRTPSLDEAYALAWAEATSRLIAFVEDHPDDACLLRYEDLLSEPEETMKALMEFLDEAWDPAIVEKGPAQIGSIGLGDWKTYEKKGLDRSSVGRWKSLSPTILQLVAPIVNPLLTTCGYDAVATTEEPQSPEKALRRYEMLMTAKAGRRDD